MEQLRALLWLRWLEFKYRFRRKEGIWSLVTAILVTLILGPIAIALGVLALIQSALYSDNLGASPGALAWIHLLLGINFLGYQITNIFDPQRCEGFDLKRLQAFPIPLSRLYRLNLLASVNDAVYLFFIPIQLGILLGLLWGMGGWAAGWIPILLLFNFLNLSLSALIGLWIGQLTQVRWRKELLVLFLPVLALLIYWLPFWFAENQRGSGHGSLFFLAQQIKVFGDYLPSGWAINAIHQLGTGKLPWIELSLLFSTGWIAYRLGLSSIRKTLMNRESVSLTIERKSSRTSSARIPLLERLGFSSEISALYEKELKYLFRSNQGRYAFVWPVIMVLMFRMILRQHEGNPFILDYFKQYQFLPFVSFLFLFFLPFYVDIFAYDHRGVRLYFFTPISIRNILLAKNLAIFSLGFLCFVEVILLYMIVFQQRVGFSLIQAMIGLPLGFLVLFIGGNILSCYFPKPLRMGALRGNNPPRVSVFSGLFLSMLTSILVSVLIVVGNLTGSLLGLSLELGALVLMILLYWITLNPMAQLYQKRREILIEAIADQEIKE